MGADGELVVRDKIAEACAVALCFGLQDKDCFLAKLRRCLLHLFLSHRVRVKEHRGGISAAGAV